MKKKHWKKISWILHSLYGIVCVFEIILCVLYRNNFDTSFGAACADLVLKLNGILFFVPALPIGFILNLLAMPPQQSEPKERRRWLIWTIASPAVCLMIYFIAVCILVVTTGGI